VDVEPDLDHVIIEKDAQTRKTANAWNSFKASADFFESLRAKLRVDETAAFSWFVRADPQVAFDFGSTDYGFRVFKEHIKNWIQEGDEVGLHVHAWRHNPRADNWIEDRTDQDWVARCVTIGFEKFKERVGYAPRIFRFGNRWMNTPTMNLLRRLGVKVEMTLEPGYRDSPWTPYLRGYTDWSSVPHSPYPPSPEDYSCPSQRSVNQLVELPLTMVAVTARRKLGKSFGVVRGMIARKKNISQVSHGPAFKEFDWYLRSKWGRLDLSLSSSTFRNAVRWELKQGQSYFGLLLRSDDCLDKRVCSSVTANLGTLIDEVGRFGCRPVFTTATKAVEMLGYG
jgi:hypothetical protein